MSLLPVNPPNFKMIRTPVSDFVHCENGNQNERFAILPTCISPSAIDIVPNGEIWRDLSLSVH